MRRRGLLLLAGAAVALAMGCARKKTADSERTPSVGSRAADGGHLLPPRGARPPRPALATLEDGQVYVPGDHDDARKAPSRTTEREARAAGLLVVDLRDGWAPFIFQDGDDSAAKPNGYRQTFVDLANERIDADGGTLGSGEHNFLEPFGIPPSLTMLRARVESDAAPERQACEARIDRDGLRAFTGNIGYLDRDRARRDHGQAVRDADWLTAEINRRETALAERSAARDGGVPRGGPIPPATWRPGDRAGAIDALRAGSDLKVRARVERALQAQARLRAVLAAQTLLTCQGLLAVGSRSTPGMFDLATHEALAAWERKNDVFGWGFLGGETLAALVRPALELDLDTFRRVLAERVADAAGIVEDGSVSKGKSPATYIDDAPAPGTSPAAAPPGAAPDASAPPGQQRLVPNLIDDHVTALLAALHVTDADDMRDFLRQQGATGLAGLRVAFHSPALPPYYGPGMDLAVEIDRGDVWYDFPFDRQGHLVEQAREHYPHLTLFAAWHGQKIPLVRWRTTIGSWRSELHANGKIYYKYKNSDVGPRFWKHIVAGPVWIPPDATPARDLLTRKVLDRNKGSEVVLNTDVMGPGFQSAYGLVMAIHIDRSGFDNQIRTHGSVDYTSIARRFSHGCHRLVNNRAVRLFDFVLKRQQFRRLGSLPLHLKRQFVVDQKSYGFELSTRGYYYELGRPIPVTVAEGRIMGRVKSPIVAYVRKAGVDYRDVAPADDTATGAGPTGPAVARPSDQTVTGAVMADSPSTPIGTPLAATSPGATSPSATSGTEPPPIEAPAASPPPAAAPSP